MRYLFVLLIGVTTSTIYLPSHGQVKKKKKTVKQVYTDSVNYLNPVPANDDCVFNDKYTTKQRLQLYPFSKAYKIAAVSYRNPSPGPLIRIEGKPEPDSSKYDEARYGLNINNGVLNELSILEYKQLDSIAIDNLTYFIWNTHFKKPNTYAKPGHNCFVPRNAFLFYNENGKIFDYLEICFECEGIESPNKKIDIGVECNQKYELIRRFFVSIGIINGTKSNLSND